MAPQWNQRNPKKLKSKNLGNGRWEEEENKRILDKTQWSYSVSGRKLRVLGLFLRVVF